MDGIKSGVMGKIALLIGFCYNYVGCIIDDKRSLPGIIIDLYQTYKYVKKIGINNIKIISDIYHNEEVSKLMKPMIGGIVGEDILDFIDIIQTNGYYDAYVDRKTLIYTIRNFITNGDKLFIYYTGHFKNNKFILPSGSNNITPIDIDTSDPILESDLFRQILIDESSPNAQIFTIFDCCDGNDLNLPFELIDIGSVIQESSISQNMTSDLSKKNYSNVNANNLSGIINNSSKKISNSSDKISDNSGKMLNNLTNHPNNYANTSNKTPNKAANNSPNITARSPKIKPREYSSSGQTMMGDLMSVTPIDVNVLQNPSLQKYDTSKLTNGHKSPTKCLYATKFNRDLKFSSQIFICISSTSCAQESYATINGSVFTGSIIRNMNKGISLLSNLKKIIDSECKLKFNQSVSIHSNRTSELSLWPWLLGAHKLDIKIDTSSNIITITLPDEVPNVTDTSKH